MLKTKKDNQVVFCKGIRYTNETLHKLHKADKEYLLKMGILAEEKPVIKTETKKESKKTTKKEETNG